ncbi:unnamed protein product [Brachionus calyciflorus]|uniref:MULE transposase domain-containing protein n=1 Tax=Brachionus calyciflorus TaxID=104777 RepID=A0A813P5K3_9BILA|nr:unnamed protein product [Brachionus calyciflorus]
MQDAQSACLTAAKQAFPNGKVLMCWFHIKQCVKKIDVKKCKPYKEMLDNHLNKMRYSAKFEQFEAVKAEALVRKSFYQDLDDLRFYFIKQWLEGGKYIEFAICKHIVAFCKLTNQPYEESGKEFIYAKKKCRPTAKAKNELAE